MILLAIETSSSRGSLALFVDGTLSREVCFPEGLLHGREITARLDDMLRAEGLRARSLGAIAVSVGPGSYTGLRVGVTAAKTLAFALGIPVVPESSLKVMAGNAAGGPPAFLLPILDGRRGHFFWGLFAMSAGEGSGLEDSIEGCIEGCIEGSVARLSPDKGTDAGEVLAALELLAVPGEPAPRVLTVGDGADLLLQALSLPFLSRGPTSWDAPRASVLGRLAVDRAALASFDREAVHRLEPAYLRVTEAERKLATKGGV